VAREKRSVQTEFARDISKDLFGAAVHRRRIHETAAERDETREHFFERLALRCLRTCIENLPTAETNHWNLFAGRRDRALENLLGGSRTSFLCGQGCSREHYPSRGLGEETRGLAPRHVSKLHQ
jgi:hypothetical protein